MTPSEFKASSRRLLQFPRHRIVRQPMTRHEIKLWLWRLRWSTKAVINASIV